MTHDEAKVWCKTLAYALEANGKSLDAAAVNILIAHSEAASEVVNAALKWQEKHLILRHGYEVDLEVACEKFLAPIPGRES